MPSVVEPLATCESAHVVAAGLPQRPANSLQVKGNFPAVTIHPDLEAARTPASPALRQVGTVRILYQMTGENWKTSGLIGTAAAITGIALLGVAGTEYDTWNPTVQNTENFFGAVLLLGGVVIDWISAFGPKKPDANGCTRHPMRHAPGKIVRFCLALLECLAPVLFCVFLFGGLMGGGFLIALGAGNLGEDDLSFSPPGMIAGGSVLVALSLFLFLMALSSRSRRSGSGDDPARRQEIEQFERDWNQFNDQQNQYQNWLHNVLHV
jgi:hypothetical protein